MPAVEVLHRDTDYHLLRTQSDPASHADWCFMHAQRFGRDLGTYRACFSVPLMKEMRDFLKRTAERANSAPASDAVPRHVVFASDANVFNLGGDLELFCRLIRERNREHLLAYRAAIAPSDWPRLTAAYGPALIELEEEDARRYAANAFTYTPAGQTSESYLVLPGGVSQKLHDAVRERGVTPVLADVSEFLKKGGGSVKCMIGDLGPLIGER